MNINRMTLNRRLAHLRWFQPCVGALALAALMWVPNLASADDNTNAPAAKVTAPQPAAKPDQPPAPKHAKKVSGVELYAIHCNRCHAERYPVEFNESQWKTLMLHMRVRANLPADQAREILKYLQDEAGY